MTNGFGKRNMKIGTGRYSRLKILQHMTYKGGIQISQIFPKFMVGGSMHLAWLTIFRNNAKDTF